MMQYRLHYQLAPEMLNRAMMSAARPRRGRNGKLRDAALGAGVFVVLVALLVVLLQYDILNYSSLFGGLFGFYAAVGLWIFVHRMSTRKLFGFANNALERHGPVDAVFNAKDVTINSAISTGRMDWRCFDDISEMPDATVLRAGGVVYAVPDAALPQGVTPPAFRADLTRWMEAAR